MDVLGQAGDPDMPNKVLELQYSSGRYFTLIYSASGALQRERGYAVLSEAASAYDDLLVGVIAGSLDPSQPVFRRAWKIDASPVGAGKSIQSGAVGVHWQKRWEGRGQQLRTRVGPDGTLPRAHPNRNIVLESLEKGI